VSPHHSPVPAIEVSDDPGEGGRGEGDAVGQQARNCPGRAFSSGAVEEQSAEGALSGIGSLTSRGRKRCIAFRRNSFTQRNSDAERDKASCFEGEPASCACLSYVQVCVCYSAQLRFNT